MQVKAPWGHKRYQVMPFAYAPAGNEAVADRESGAGSLAEFELFGRGKTVVGVSLLHGTSDHRTRQMMADMRGLALVSGACSWSTTSPSGGMIRR